MARSGGGVAAKVVAAFGVGWDKDAGRRVMDDEVFESLSGIKGSGCQPDEWVEVCRGPTAEFEGGCEICFIEWAVPVEPEHVPCAPVIGELGKLPVVPDDAVTRAVVEENAATGNRLSDAHASAKVPTRPTCGTTARREVEGRVALRTNQCGPQQDDEARARGEIHRGQNVFRDRSVREWLLDGRGHLFYQCQRASSSRGIR